MLYSKKTDIYIRNYSQALNIDEIITSLLKLKHN